MGKEYQGNWICPDLKWLQIVSEASFWKVCNVSFASIDGEKFIACLGIRYISFLRTPLIGIKLNSTSFGKWLQEIGYGLEARGIVVRLPPGVRDLYLLQRTISAHPASNSTGTGGLNRGRSDWDVKLTTHLHLATKLRMSRDKPPLHHMP